MVNEFKNLKLKTQVVFAQEFELHFQILIPLLLLCFRNTPEITIPRTQGKLLPLWDSN